MNAWNDRACLRRLKSCRGAWLLVAAIGVLAGAPAHAAAIELRNLAYRMRIDADAIEVSRAREPALTRSIAPGLTLQVAARDPHLAAGAGVVSWKQEAGDRNDDYTQIGTTVTLKPCGVRAADGAAEIDFDATDHGQATLRISLPPGEEPPRITWSFTPSREGWFSVGFTGLQPRDPARLDFVYQPLIWSWRRFPQTPVLTPECFATTAVCFCTGGGFTEGLAPDVAEIPYRFATPANSRFGLALRDANGRARPAVFAPILGGAESRMKAGETRQFSVRYILEAGDWYAGLTHFYRHVAGYRRERQNAEWTLNQTLENMLDYAMNDTYGGWVEPLKASDYRFDVPGTVKNVAASHPLSLALTTGNLDIYRRRALPMIEYLLSREKYLYSVSEEITLQSPSHFLRGPAVEIGELAALHELSGGVNGVFLREARRVFGKPRTLNLNTVTGPGRWQDWLALYRMSRDPADLEQACTLADAYVQADVWNYPVDFSSTSGLRDPQAAFVTDYTPCLYDLIELHEASGERRYLDAALLAARQMLLWMRSNPLAPSSTIVANPGGRVPGIFPGRRHERNSYEFKAFDTTTVIPEQRVPAWRTSLVGLPPEALSTYAYGPIMLAHHAPWFLRLSHHCRDGFLRDAAVNAVIGRYANFPGYYFTSLDTTVYQQPDYATHPYVEVKYNAIFYNHIWPHIALLQDYLVSEAYLKSGGQVSFPSAYAPGYAFLTSKVYGHGAGTVFGHTNVRLWLPPKALQSSCTALNHLFGTGPDATYLIVCNTHPADVSADIRLNGDRLRLDCDRRYDLTIYRPGSAPGDSPAAPETGVLENGMLTIRVGADSMAAIRIHGLVNQQRSVQPDSATTPEAPDPAERRDYFRHAGPPAVGTVTGMLLRFMNLCTDAYVYADATEKTARAMTLHYRIGAHPEQVIEDREYPYEFSIPMPVADVVLQMRLVAEDAAGTCTEVALPSLGEGVARPEGGEAD